MGGVRKDDTGTGGHFCLNTVCRHIPISPSKVGGGRRSYRPHGIYLNVLCIVSVVAPETWRELYLSVFLWLHGPGQNSLVFSMYYK